MEDCPDFIVSNDLGLVMAFLAKPRAEYDPFTALAEFKHWANSKLSTPAPKEA